MRVPAPSPPMIVFYWIAGIAFGLTALPAAFFFALYIISGEDGCQRRAVKCYRWASTIFLFSFNVILWKHVILGFWALFFG